MSQFEVISFTCYLIQEVVKDNEGKELEETTLLERPISPGLLLDIYRLFFNSEFDDDGALFIFNKKPNDTELVISSS